MSSVVLARSMDEDTSASSDDSESKDLLVVKYGCNSEVRETLKHEYQALKTISHPHIIKPVSFHCEREAG